MSKLIQIYIHLLKSYHCHINSILAAPLTDKSSVPIFTDTGSNILQHWPAANTRQLYHLWIWFVNGVVQWTLGHSCDPWIWLCKQDGPVDLLALWPWTWIRKWHGPADSSATSTFDYVNWMVLQTYSLCDPWIWLCKLNGPVDLLALSPQNWWEVLYVSY